MNDNDKRLLADKQALLTMGIGCGKTLSATVLAHWHLLNDEGPENESTAEDATGTDYAPLSTEELDARLAALAGMTVEPLPEEIESLSDRSRFLVDAEPEENDLVTRRTSHLQPIRLSSEEWTRVPLSGRSHGDMIPDFNQVAQNFSTVLLVREEEESNSVQTASQGLPASSRQYQPGTRDAGLWTAVLAWVKSIEETGRARAQLLRQREELFHPHDFLDAVHDYALRANNVCIIVDNIGAAEDPREVLDSVIAAATRMGTAVAQDGKWALICTAPAVAEEPGRGKGGPRLAVMELPGDPPPLRRQDENGDEYLGPDAQMLRTLMSALNCDRRNR